MKHQQPDSHKTTVSRSPVQCVTTAVRIALIGLIIWFGGVASLQAWNLFADAPRAQPVNVVQLMHDHPAITKWTTGRWAVDTSLALDIESLTDAELNARWNDNGIAPSGDIDDFEAAILAWYGALPEPVEQVDEGIETKSGGRDGMRFRVTIDTAGQQQRLKAGICAWQTDGAAWLCMRVSQRPATLDQDAPSLLPVPVDTCRLATRWSEDGSLTAEIHAVEFSFADLCAKWESAGGRVTQRVQRGTCSIADLDLPGRSPLLAVYGRTDSRIGFLLLVDIASMSLEI